LCAFVDHGPDGTGEPLAVALRPGNTGSAADHITLTDQALRQLPSHRPGTRPGRRVLIRVDGGARPDKSLNWLSGQRLSYSVGFALPDNTSQVLALIPEQVWAPTYEAHDHVRDGAWVAELTDLLDLSKWPAGMRVTARRERPIPAPSYGSPTSTGTGSPPSPPTPRQVVSVPSWPTWNCGIAAGPAARTGSGPPRTPG